MPMTRQPNDTPASRRSACAALAPIAAPVLAALLVLSAPARAGDAPAADPHAQHDHAAPDDATGDPHAHHHHMMEAPPPVLRSTINYSVPDVTLVRADGERVKLARELDDGHPVLLDFIYTTCTTICPVQSQTFAMLQKRLGSDASKIKMISISIDPEEDTPARLMDYSKRFHAGAQWQFYTGTVEASIAAQSAFNAYRGDKMSHASVTFFRSAPGQPWVRLDGFVTPDALMSELRATVAQK
jgi:protein SCO1